MRCKGIDGAVGIRLAQRVGVGIWRVSVRRTLASLAHLANCGSPARVAQGSGVRGGDELFEHSRAFADGGP